MNKASRSTALLDKLAEMRRMPLDQIPPDEAKEVVQDVIKKGTHHVPVEVARFNSNI